VRDPSAMPAAGRQFEMGGGARDLEKDTVITAVVVEAADFDQSDAVSVERDDLVQSLCVSGHTELHVRPVCL
jgi:hypothetical protein